MIVELAKLIGGHVDLNQEQVEASKLLSQKERLSNTAWLILSFLVGAFLMMQGFFLGGTWVFSLLGIFIMTYSIFAGLSRLSRSKTSEYVLWLFEAKLSRFFVRSFRITAGVAIGFLAFEIIVWAFGTLSTPFAALSPLQLIGGLLGIIIGPLTAGLALWIAFGEGDQSEKVRL